MTPKLLKLPHLTLGPPTAETIALLVERVTGQKPDLAKIAAKLAKLAATPPPKPS